MMPIVIVHKDCTEYCVSILASQVYTKNKTVLSNVFATATPVVHTDCTHELAGEHHTVLMPNSESQRQEDANAEPTIGQQAMSVNGHVSTKAPQSTFAQFYLTELYTMIALAVVLAVL